MAGLLRTYTKSAYERRRFYVDYSCWLEESEQLSEFTLVVAPFTRDAPLVTNGAFSDVQNKKMIMFIAGGRAGVTYTVSIMTKTNAGQAKQDNIGIRVSAA